MFGSTLLIAIGIIFSWIKNLVAKLDDLFQSNSMLQNSIQTSNNDTSTNLRDEEGRPLKVCYPVLCQCRMQLFGTINSQHYNAKQKCDDQIWMHGRRILQEITNNKSVLQKPNPNFPSMMQTQIQATNVR